MLAEVRAAKHGIRVFLAQLRKGDIKPVAFEHGGDLLVALVPLGLHPVEHRAQLGRGGVDEVAEDVDVVEDTSIPGTTSTPSSAPARIASGTPETLSWSVMLTAARPRDAAFSTAARGESVPSEAVVWICRSMQFMDGCASFSRKYRARQGFQL